MFEIPVKIDGIEKRRRSVGLFHILAGLFLGANTSLLIKSLNYSNFWPLLPIYAIAFASLLYGSMRKKIDPRARYNRLLRFLQFFTFLGLAIYMLRSVTAIQSLSLFLWAGICLALFLTERLVFSQPVLNIRKEGITAPGTFSDKKIDWSEVESVIVRKDYITLNYRTNRYLQLEVLGNLTGTEIERIILLCNEHAGKQEI